MKRSNWEMKKKLLRAEGSMLSKGRKIQTAESLWFLRVFSTLHDIISLNSSSVFVLLFMFAFTANAQTKEPVAIKSEPVKPQAVQPDQQSSLTKYFAPGNGLTADDAVANALAHNGELLAARKEVDAGRALVKQAGLRANPALEVNGARQLDGKDNQLMISSMWPLELGGRRVARITVAQRELELREQAVANRERLIAAEVRAKFGQALADILKLGFTEELLANSRRGYRLVQARVIEGRTAPLEQNMVLVEVNRLRSVRETDEGRVEIALLELRNLMGMQPEEPLRLSGDFDKLIGPLLPLSEATAQALRNRPDLEGYRATERLAEARILEARTQGRVDASINAGYQRMNSSFPVFGINDVGQLQPVQDVFNFVTFGVTVSVPVRNKNQGAIEAATAEMGAAKQRREFAELSIRREVASAYAQYESAARAMQIYRVGVKEQASSNLEVVRQTYELGSKTLLDYIAEQRRYIELENTYIDSLLATYSAQVEIARASASPELINK